MESEPLAGMPARFRKVPYRAVRDTSLPAGALRLLIAIACNADGDGRCALPADRLAADVGLTPDDIGRFSGQLSESRYVTASQDGHGVTVAIEQEPGSSGKIAAHDWRRKLKGYAFRSVPSTGDKTVRSNPVASDAEAGEVLLVRAPWNEAFLAEHEMFVGDGSGHDDVVDATSGAHAQLFKAGVSPEDLYGEGAAA